MRNISYKILRIFFIIFAPFECLHRVFARIKGFNNARLFGELVAVTISILSICKGFKDFMELLPISILVCLPLLFLIYFCCNITFTILYYLFCQLGYIITWIPNYFRKKYKYVFKAPETIEECIRYSANFKKFNIDAFERKVGPIPPYWYRYGRLYLFDDKILNENRTFYISEFKKVEYKALPIQKLSEYECVAIICLILTFKNGKTLYINLAKEVLQYQFFNRKVKFYYPNHFKDLIMILYHGITDGNFENQRLEQEAKRKQQKQQEYNKNNSHVTDDVRSALEFFDLDEDFTEGELKKCFHECSKKAHPDTQKVASEDLQKIINLNKDILCQYLKTKKRCL